MYVIALQGWVETKWEKTKYIEKKNLGHFCAFITSESDSKCRKQYRVAHGLAACLPDRKTWASSQGVKYYVPITRCHIMPIC